MLSLFDADDAERMAALLTDSAVRIVIPKMVSLQALDTFVRRLAPASHRGLTIVVGDATIALLAGDPIAMKRWIDAAAAHGLTMGYMRAIRVAAMTVNPFYPLPQEHAFVPAYIDKEELLRSVSDNVDVPVFNIKDEGAASALYDLIRQ
jgi:hypothetical protein